MGAIGVGNFWTRSPSNSEKAECVREELFVEDVKIRCGDMGSCRGMEILRLKFVPRAARESRDLLTHANSCCSEPDDQDDSQMSIVFVLACVLVLICVIVCFGALVG